MSTISTWVRLAVLASAAAATMHATDASAQDAQSIAQARFEAGRREFEARQYERAIEEFSQSLRAYSSPNTRLYFARSLRDAGRLVDAVLELRRTVREAADLAAASPRYRLTEETARAELAALEPRVGQLDLRGSALPARAVLRVGSQTLPAEAVGTTVLVLPGAVAVHVEAPGFEPFDRSINVEAGQRASIDVAMTAQRTVDSGTPPPRAQPDPQRREPPSGQGPRQPTFSVIPAAVSYGIGGAALAAFGGLYAVSEGQFQQLRGLCPIGVAASDCAPSAAGIADSGRSTETASMVALGVGAAGVVIGTTLLVVHLRSGPRAERSVAVIPLQNGASITVGGRF